MSVRNVLTRFLAAVYIFAGGIKVYPPTPGFKLDMDKTFSNFASACPTVLFGYKPEGSLYRFTTGCVELTLGLVLLFGPRIMKQISCIGLMIIMAGAVQTMIHFHDYKQMIVPAFFFLALGYQFKILSSTPSSKTKKA
ncbi:hypothetical protein LOTGIDRAFT_163730 [Lottia gigantea]|uniref:Transmembrane protein 35A n=1 Tax=Lottia gigantea TaxID=225164 RepID=V4AC42_LOTGI|nr:hypothetical protein LOTGIDRAFT_163730 [Lottia gigantea]ESO90846.1 hypothetical protein LOTGIDRAFT_163730 [Lottia gigantea]